MSLYRDSAAGVRAQIAASTLVPTMSEQFAITYGHRPSPGEVRSWERSISVLANDLHDAGLDQVEILLEYRLPLTSRRVDALLCGVHPRTTDWSYVVVELKQWSRATPVDGTDVVLDDGSGRRLHPAAQVGGYCDYIADFNGSLGGTTDRLSGVAYLHNANDDGIAGLWVYPQSRTTRMFTGQRRGEFLTFLQSVLAPSPGAEAADDLMTAAIKPSKQLMALAAREIRDREQFVLIDQQQVAYSMVMRAVDRARAASTKHVVIVTGGPGSGESVIALSLLGELSRQGRTVLHATGSSAFTQTLRKVAGARAPRVRSLFTYYNNFGDAVTNGLEVLINDEAHRIRETSTNRWTPAAKRSGRPQVEDLIDAARVSVFLLDEHQVVKPGERGSVADIESAAIQLGCEVIRVDLNDQFRLGGAAPTRSGCSACSVSSPAARSAGQVPNLSISTSPTRRRRWRPGCRHASRPGTPAASPRATAGAGASRKPTTCSLTSRSMVGSVPGTTPRTHASATHPADRSGRPTPMASTRSGASTRRKVSSTTTAA